MNLQRKNDVSMPSIEAFFYGKRYRKYKNLIYLSERLAFLTNIDYYKSCS